MDPAGILLIMSNHHLDLSKHMIKTPSLLSPKFLSSTADTFNRSTWDGTPWLCWPGNANAGHKKALPKPSRFFCETRIKLAYSLPIPSLPVIPCEDRCLKP